MQRRNDLARAIDIVLVAVDLDQVVARAGRDGRVADGGDAEPAALVPDMADGDG